MKPQPLWISLNSGKVPIMNTEKASAVLMIHEIVIDEDGNIDVVWKKMRVWLDSDIVYCNPIKGHPFFGRLPLFCKKST